jgi:hypothetical protein
MIRSTPVVDASSVYFGTCSGRIIALDRSNGDVRWTSTTVGDTLVNDLYGFDRKALISSPTLDGDRLYIGSRDGFLYALDKRTGAQIWKRDYAVSWVISTPAIKDDILVVGTSDGRYIHALHTTDGSEIWRRMTHGPVWASAAIARNNALVIPGNDGVVYALELRTGDELWRYRVGMQIFSSVTPVGNALYVGSDDGTLHALTTVHADLKPLRSIRRAVFWMRTPPFQPFKSGMDVAVRDYFIQEGYEYYDQTDLRDFLLSRIASDTASVVVFASNYLIPSIVSDTLGSNIFREYLESGGKAVFLGLNPGVYQFDAARRQVVGIDFTLSQKTTGIEYQYGDLRSHGGYYSSGITEAGRLWGLRKPFVGVAGMPAGEVDVPLAIDENGRASAWVKHFSGRMGSGFVQLFLTPDRLDELPDVQRVAEYGLR